MLPEAWGVCTSEHRVQLPVLTCVRLTCGVLTPMSRKGRDARVVAASPSLPPFLPFTLLPPWESRDSSPAGHRTLSVENSSRSGCRAETHAFLLSFPKNKVAPFAFPFWFLLKTAYGLLPRRALLVGRASSGRWLDRWWRAGCHPGAALAVPAGTGLLILLQCAFPPRPVSYPLLEEPFLALSSASLCYLPRIGDWSVL